MDNRTLYFPTGTAWPAVKVSKGRPLRGHGPPAGRVPRALPLGFTLTTSGEPQAWTAHAPKAIWRTWVDAMYGPGKELGRFVARYGDPLDKLSVDHPIDTESWLPLLADLTTIADAWGSAHADTGISEVECADDAVARLRVFGFQHPAPVTIAVESSAQPRIVLRADTFAAFMVASATSALDRKAVMRKCRQCMDWFELPRIDAYFCSVVCRNAHYRAAVASGGMNLNEVIAMKTERAAIKDSINAKIKKQKRSGAS